MGTDVWQSCSVLETKVYVLSVSHPAKRKCLIMDTDQPVKDTSSDLLIKHHTMGYPVLLQLLKTPFLLMPLEMKQ